MKKYLLISLFVFVLAKSDSAQNYEWLQSVSPTSGMEVKDIETDSLGNLYIAGVFSSFCNFNGTPLNSQGQWDVFLAKYDTAGNFAWVKQAGGIADDFLNSISLDDSGNIYMTGSFHDSADFDTITLSDSGVFVVKYSNIGSVKWANKFKVNTTINIFDFDIETSKEGETYVIGSFLDSAEFDTTKIFSLGVSDLFLTKLNSNGKFQWVRKALVSQNLNGIGIDLDSYGNPIIVGIFTGSATFDTVTVNASGGNSDMDLFIVKYDTLGDVLWGKSYGTSVSTHDYPDITIDKVSNNIFVTDFLSSSLPNFYGLFVTKFDSIGTPIWITDTVTLKHDIYLNRRHIKSDRFGCTYLVGNINFTTNFFGVKEFSYANEAVFAKFDSSGKFDWVKRGVSNLSSHGGGLCLDNNLNVYFAGDFQDSVAFDQFSFKSSLALSGNIYIVKISQTGIGIADSIVITNYKSPTDSAFKDNHTTSILADTNGIIYSGSISGGLVIYNGITWQSYNTSNSSIPSDSISNLFLDDSNQVWICTYDSGLVKFDPLNWKSFNTGNSTIPTNHITCGEWSNDTIFLGSDLDDVVITDGVVWFDSYTNVYPGIPHDGVNSIKEDQQGILWIATNDSGLARVDTGGVTVYNYSNSGLPANRVQCLYVDANNTLWLGTDSNGLASFDGTNWRMFNSHNTTLPDNNIQSIVSGPSGKILVGTQSKGVGIFDGYIWELINDVIGLPDSNVTSIIFSDSVYWAGLHDLGVVKFALPNDFPVGVENEFQKIGNNLLCYPNPFTSRIVVSYSLEKITDTKIRMFDVMGKLVTELRIKKQMPGKYELGINDISLPDGLYFLQLLTDKVSQTARVVVTH